MAQSIMPGARRNVAVSPAVAFVGRHNSGKTTLIERVIAELTARGFDVGSIKHHSHKGFDIDIPGKDSYRHRAAGATDTVIAAPGQVARISTVRGELECADILEGMPGHDIVVVEGYRKSGLPTIEIMRAGNEADAVVAQAFLEGAQAGASLGTDFIQAGRARLRAERERDEKAAGGVEGAASAKAAGARAADEKGASAEAPSAATPAAESALSASDQAKHAADLRSKMPSGATIAVVTDIPAALEAARIYGIPAFGLDDIAPVCDFLVEHHVRRRITVAIQAGGESRRMGRSKATVPFAGRPLICRLVERLAPAADKMLITTNEAENLAFLHEQYPDLGIRLVPDICDHRGALPGIHSALRAAESEYVAIVACDMVCASSALVVREAALMAATMADVVVPVNKHGFEPFHALYRRSTCLPVVEAAVAAGEQRAQAIFDRVKVQPLPQSEVLKVEPMGGCFINVNTPEELKIMEKAFAEE